jgi:hypothetical protein
MQRVRVGRGIPPLRLKNDLTLYKEQFVTKKSEEYNFIGLIQEIYMYY